MDASFVGAAFASLSAAKEIGKAAIGIRDFNQMAATVSQLNEQILKAQDALFSHQTQLINLQDELLQAKEKLRIAEKVIEERGRYELFQLSQGVFVYRAKVGEEGLAAGAEPIHYLCQPCFDGGKKSVLVRHDTATGFAHHCSLCKIAFRETTVPFRPIRVKSEWNPYT
jgi:hypothetical protein